MKIGLIDVDGHNFPNLALMKLSAWHKKNGDDVEWWDGFAHYDRVYMSKVFDETYTPDSYDPANADEIIRGGTGYNLQNTLPDAVEHIYPDYSLYPALTKGTAYGFLTRGCPRGCPFCIVAKKEGRASRKVADLSEWWKGQKNIKLLDPNILACQSHMELLNQLVDSKAWIDFTQGLDIRLVDDEIIDALNRIKIKMLHFAWDNPKDDLAERFQYFTERYAINDHRRKSVYVLVNYNSTMEENLYRITTLRELGYSPYVMIYDKPNAPIEIRYLQRWCNNPLIFRSVPNFYDYDHTMG